MRTDLETRLCIPRETASLARAQVSLFIRALEWPMGLRVILCNAVATVSYTAGLP